MVLPQRISVANRDQSDSVVLHVRVEVAFDVDANCRSAFVEDGINRLVVDQARHSDALFLAA